MINDLTKTVRRFNAQLLQELLVQHLLINQHPATIDLGNFVAIAEKILKHLALWSRLITL